MLRVIKIPVNNHFIPADKQLFFAILNSLLKGNYFF